MRPSSTLVSSITRPENDVEEEIHCSLSDKFFRGLKSPGVFRNLEPSFLDFFKDLPFTFTFFDTKWWGVPLPLLVQ